MLVSEDEEEEPETTMNDVQEAIEDDVATFCELPFMNPDASEPTEAQEEVIKEVIEEKLTEVVEEVADEVAIEKVHD